MRCPEAGTSDVHRAAIASARPTAPTRAFSGRLARGVVNRFMREHELEAPVAYPEVHHLTAPLRARGREDGDEEVVNLWAGQTHELAQPLPAAEVVKQLYLDARTALDAAGQRLSKPGS
jgi:nitronate monooxygenase